MSFQNTRSISLPVDLNNVVTQYDFVTLDTDGNAAEVTDGSAQYVIGVALEGSTATDEAAIPVAILDGAVMEANAGGVFAIGDGVIVGDNGKAFAHDSAAAGSTPAGTYQIVGIAQNVTEADDRLTFVSGHFGTVTLA